MTVTTMSLRYSLKSWRLLMLWLQLKKAFRPEKKSKFPRLRHLILDGEEKMFCPHCLKSGSKNGFTRRVMNMKSSLSTLDDIILHIACLSVVLSSVKTDNI